MTKQIINIPDAPKLPLSPAVKAGDYIFVSGQIGFRDSKTGEEVKGFENQLRQCLENMKRVLKAADSALSDVVKVNVFLRNADDFVKMNEVYQSYFTEDQPARSTIVTAFNRPDMLVEVECIAYRP